MVAYLLCSSHRPAYPITPPSRMKRPPFSLYMPPKCFIIFGTNQSRTTLPYVLKSGPTKCEQIFIGCGGIEINGTDAKIRMLYSCEI